MDGTTKKEMVFVAGSAMAPKPDWSSESWTGWTTFARQTTVLHNRALRSVARTAACVRIAQDRTRSHNEFD